MTRSQLVDSCIAVSVVLEALLWSVVTVISYLFWFSIRVRNLQCSSDPFRELAESAGVGTLSQVLETTVTRVAVLWGAVWFVGSVLLRGEFCGVLFLRSTYGVSGVFNRLASLFSLYSHSGWLGTVSCKVMEFWWCGRTA